MKDKLLIVILLIIIVIITIYIIICKRTRNNNEKSNYNLLKNKEKFVETEETDPNILAIKDLNLTFKLQNISFNKDNETHTLITLEGDNYILKDKTIKYISFNDLILNDKYIIEKDKSIYNYVKLIDNNNINDTDEFTSKLNEFIKEYEITTDGKNTKRNIRIIKGPDNKPEPLTYLLDKLDKVNAYLKKEGVNYQLTKDENFKKHDYFIAKITGEEIGKYRPFTCFKGYRKGKDKLKRSTYAINCGISSKNKYKKYGNDKMPTRIDISETKTYFLNNEINLKIVRSNKGFYNIKLKQKEDDYFESYFYDLRTDVVDDKNKLIKKNNTSTFIVMFNNSKDYLLKRVNIPLNKTLVLITEDDQEIEIDKSTNHIDRSNANLISSGHPNICEISMDDINISLRKGFIKKPKKPKVNFIKDTVKFGIDVITFGKTKINSRANRMDSYKDNLRAWKMTSQKLSLDSNLGICKKEYTIKDAKLVDKDVYLTKKSDTEFSFDTNPQDFIIKITNSVIKQDFLIYNNERTKLITKNDNGLLSIIDTSNKDTDKNIKNYIFNKDIHINNANKNYYKLFNDNIEYIIYKIEPENYEYFILYEDATDNYNYKFLNSDTEKFELYNPDNKDNYKFRIYLNSIIEPFKNINGIEHFINELGVTIVEANINKNISNYKNKIYTDKFFIKKDTDNKIVNEKGEIMFYDTTKTTENLLFKDTLQYSEELGTIYYDEDNKKLYYNSIDKWINSNDNNLYKKITKKILIISSNDILPNIINTKLPNVISFEKSNNENLIMKDKYSNRVFHCIYKKNKNYSMNLLNNANEIKYYALYKNNELIEAYSPYFYVNSTNSIQFIIPKNNNDLTVVIPDINKNDYLQLEKSTELTNKINCLNGSTLCSTKHSSKINDYNPTIYEDYNYYSLINIDTILIDKRETTTNTNTNYKLNKLKLTNTTDTTDTNKIFYNITLTLTTGSSPFDVYFEYRENPITKQLEPEQTSSIISNIDLNISEQNTYNNNYLDELQKINSSLDINIANLNTIKIKHNNKIKQIKSVIERSNNAFIKKVEMLFIPLYQNTQLAVYELYEVNKEISKISYQIQNKIKFAVNIDDQTKLISELNDKKESLSKLQETLTIKLKNSHNKKYDELIRTQILIEEANLLIIEINKLNNLLNKSKETFEDSNNIPLQLKYDEYNNQQSQSYKDNIYNLHLELQIKNNEQQKLNDVIELLQKLYEEHYIPINLMLSNSDDENTYNYHLNKLIDTFNTMKSKLNITKINRTADLASYKKEFKKQNMVSIDYKTNNLEVYTLELEIETLQTNNNQLNSQIEEINNLSPFNLQSKLKKLKDLKYTLTHNLTKYDAFEPFTTASSQYNSNQLAMNNINKNNKQYKILMNGKCLSSYKAKDYKLTNCNMDSNSQYFSPRLIQNKLQAKNINKDNVIPSDKIKYPYYQIRSSLSNDCLLSDVDGIKITPCSSNNIKQQWKISKNDNICINN